MSALSLSDSLSHTVRFTRRHLQIALGLLWLLDGALQLQPFMLRTSFARQILDPVAAGPVHWAANLIAAHPVAWDVPFAAVQLLIGVGLLVPRTAKLSLAAWLPWALAVWFFGEGLSGLASGHVSLLNGAPGSVLLYGVLALVAWPRNDASHEAPARWLPVAWAVLWVGAAIFQALPGQNTGTDVAGTIGFVLALAIWVTGQDFGLLYTGQATDPNTALVIAVMAIAVVGVSRALVGARVRARAVHDTGRVARREHGSPARP